MGHGILGVVLVALGGWLAISWIDAGYDSTCENAFRYWTADYRRPSCQTQMSIRLLATMALASLGCCYVGLAIVGENVKKLIRLASPTFVAVTLLVVTVMTIWNEFARDGGLWANG